MSTERKKKKRQKTKRKEETKDKVDSVRLSKSSKLTMEAIKEMFPDFNKTDVFEWAFTSLRKDMLEDGQYLPKSIRLKIIRAEITRLEKEVKTEKFALIHARNRAVSWNRVYEEVNKDEQPQDVRVIQLKHLKNSKVLDHWKEKNEQIIALHEQFKKVLEDEDV